MAPPTQQDPKDIVRQHFTAINERDQETVAELHAEDVVVHSAGRDLEGIDAVIEDWWEQLEAIPDLSGPITVVITGLP